MPATVTPVTSKPVQITNKLLSSTPAATGASALKSKAQPEKQMPMMSRSTNNLGLSAQVKLLKHENGKLASVVDYQSNQTKSLANKVAVLDVGVALGSNEPAPAPNLSALAVTKKPTEPVRSGYNSVSKTTLNLKAKGARDLDIEAMMGGGRADRSTAPTASLTRAQQRQRRQRTGQPPPANVSSRASNNSRSYQSIYERKASKRLEARAGVTTITDVGETSRASKTGPGYLS